MFFQLFFDVKGPIVVRQGNVLFNLLVNDTRPLNQIDFHRALSDFFLFIYCDELTQS